MIGGVIIASLLLAAMASAMPLSECREKAAAGDAEALWQLGQRYERGDGVRKDGLRAVSQYRKAAEKDHAKACGRLAELYEAGKFVAKDPVKAARYRAKSRGESVEAAAAIAQTAQERARVDPIEVALDYVIGRNGVDRDAKKGIALLYAEAKDNPTAQRVFVERWEKGDLDAGLDTLDGDDWKLVLPWFKAQYDRGRRKGGMVLGNEAYREGRYSAAVDYWRASGAAGLAKSWFLLGKFYCYEEKDGGGPKHMRSDVKAKKAFERCLALDSSWTDAKINVGFLCLFGDERCTDYRRAMDIFSGAMNAWPDDVRYPYWYGLAGRNETWRQFDLRWKQSRVKELQSRAKFGALTQADHLDIQRYNEDVGRCEAATEKYMRYVLNSANRGHEPAKECYQAWDKERKKGK